MPRRHHSAVYVHNPKRMLIVYGGIDNYGNYLNETWKFSMPKNKWK